MGACLHFLPATCNPQRSIQRVDPKGNVFLTLAASTLVAFTTFLMASANLLLASAALVALGLTAFSLMASATLPLASAALVALNLACSGQEC